MTKEATPTESTFRPSKKLSRRGRIAATVGLVLALFPAGCSGPTRISTPPKLLTQGTDGWFSDSPRKDETVKIRFDPNYAGGSAEVVICTTRRFAGEYARELQGDKRDPRDVVAESRSMPTGAVDNGQCWVTYPDIYFATNNQVDVSTGVGDTIQAPYDDLERYRITRDGKGALSVQDMGHQAVNTSSINTSQANP